MPSKSRSAALIAAFLGATVLWGAPALADTPKLSSGVAENLQDAVKALHAKDFKTALADVMKAQAEDDRSDFDNFRINQFLAITYNDLGDKAKAETAAVAAADSSVIPDEDKAETFIRAMALSVDNKHYKQSVKYGKMFEALGKPNIQVTEEMLQAYVLDGDTANAQIYLNKVEAANKAAGKTKPDEFLLQTQFNIYVKEKNEDGAEKTLTLLAVNYNQPSDWTQLINVTFIKKGLRVPDIIHLGRLLAATGVSVPPDDATLVAEASYHLAFYGDTQRAETHGAKRIPGLAAKIAADKKTLAKQIAMGPKQNGRYNVELADALYGYGHYADAETAARAAIAKGGVKDPSEPPMVLGEALFAQGKYADAATAFASVKGGGPVTGRIANIWYEYAKAKARDAAAPAPAPAKTTP